MSDDKTVRAAVIHAPGDITIENYPMPDIAGDAGLLKVEATGIVGTDFEYYSGRGSSPKDFDFTLRFPFIPGHIIVGRIAKLGRVAAQRWGLKEGDRVNMQFNVSCGHCARCQVYDERRCENIAGYGLWFDMSKPPYLWGGAAEYMMLHPNSKMVKVPDDADPEHLCFQERLADGLAWVVGAGELTARDSLLVFGTGALAQSAIMVGKWAGAAPVIAVARPGSLRAAQCVAAGADHVISGSHEEIVEQVLKLTGGRGASVSLDLTQRDSFEVTRTAIEAAAIKGRVIQVSVKTPGYMQGIMASKIVAKELTFRGVLGHDFEYLQSAMRLAQEPEIKRATAALKFASRPLEQAKDAMENPPGGDGATISIIRPWG